MKLHVTPVLLSILVIGLTRTANAVPITYDYHGTFENGSTYSGFFQYDTSGNPHSQDFVFGMTTADESFGTPGGLDLFTDSALFMNDSADDYSIRGMIDGITPGPPLEFTLFLILVSPPDLSLPFPTVLGGSALIEQAGNPIRLRGGFLTVTQRVPEPSTSFLLGIGLLATLVARYKRRQR